MPTHWRPFLPLVSMLVAVAAGHGHAAGGQLDECERVRNEWMQPSRVDPPEAINRDGLEGRVLCGYQGWFTAEGDGAGLDWRHWRKKDPEAPGGWSPSIDLLPDVSELPPEERFPSDLIGGDARPIELFSSHLRPTVIRHFRWMREHGIDGVFVQRFGTTLRNPRLLAHATKVLGSCRDGALEHGRVYAVMYDLSKMQPNSLETVLEDWRHLRSRMKIGDDAAALRVNGLPLVAVWGIGFAKDRDYTLEESRRLVAALKADGCAVLCGVPTGWRTLNRDSTADPLLHEILGACDVVCPWTVGRYATEHAASQHAQSVWKADVEWCAARNIDYLPVIFPGFSWHNLKGGKLDQIPRRGGRFLWTQAVGARHAGVDSVYVAMFDEVDEATAIFKCIDPPTPELAQRFVGLENLPSDHYLRLTGEIRRMLRGELAPSEEIPETSRRGAVR